MGLTRQLAGPSLLVPAQYGSSFVFLSTHRVKVRAGELSLLLSPFPHPWALVGHGEFAVSLQSLSYPLKPNYGTRLPTEHPGSGESICEGL